MCSEYFTIISRKGYRRRLCRLEGYKSPISLHNISYQTYSGHLKDYNLTCNLIFLNFDITYRTSLGEVFIRC